MGFAQSQCELAMELAMNNAEVALNYLLTGEIVAAAPAATSNGQQPLQSTAESYFGQGCGAVTACDVSQYSFGERGGRSACTAIALEAATTLLHPSSGLFSTSAAPPNPPTAATAGPASSSLTGPVLAAIVERGVTSFASLNQGKQETAARRQLAEVQEIAAQKRGVAAAAREAANAAEAAATQVAAGVGAAEVQAAAPTAAAGAQLSAEMANADEEATTAAATAATTATAASAAAAEASAAERAAAEAAAAEAAAVATLAALTGDGNGGGSGDFGVVPEHTSVEEVLPAVARFRNALRWVGFSPPPLAAPTGTGATAATGTGAGAETAGNGAVLQGLTTADGCYESLVSQAQGLPGYSPTLPLALVITKPPETILLLVPPRTGVGALAQQWFIVDSHSRPQFGLEGCFALPASSCAALVHGGLQHIFPPVRMDEFGGGASMMEQMYNAIEAYPIQLLGEG